MKNTVVLLFAATFGLGMAAHAADSEIKATPKKEQIEKLRTQADGEHKKEKNPQSGEKMRGKSRPDQGCNDGAHYVAGRGSCTMNQ